jgi:hypothetical protein
MTVAYTVVRREYTLIPSSNKDKQGTQFQPITSKDIPDWVIKLLNGIKGELGQMVTLIQAPREKNLEIQMALPG